MPRAANRGWITDDNQQTASASTLEVQQALCDGDYARALRRLVKRREAIASASPFLTAVVAFAESWLYENGVLCHIRDRQLRLLDVHHSAAQETVVHIPKLLDEAIPESRSCRKYKFRLLYHAYGVISCLYTHAKPQLAHWLVVFSPKEETVLTARRLDCARNIFARNNADYVYYGVQSAIGDDGFRRWVLRGFNIRKREWLADSLSLPDTVGSEIDATVCFEIIDGYFCTLANHTSFELEGIEYTSYYHFFRFPLDRPSHEHMERPTKRDLFRRQHSEGPIDDRWTFMKIFTDELSGELKAIESRKEWLSGSSSATRTYYTKTLRITETDRRAGSSIHTSYEDEDEDEGQYAQNNRLAQFLGAPTKSNKNGEAPDRDPSEVHVGDDGSTSLMFTLSRCFIRSYHPASQAFLDLVDDPRESEPGNQRIRIRAGTRLPRASSSRQSEVVSWPPDGCSSGLDELYRVLNPPGYTGDVHGTWDQRSLVYATGGGTKGGVKALVLASFDPSIYLKGTMSFDDRSTASPGKLDLGTALRVAQDVFAPDRGKGEGEQETLVSRQHHTLGDEAKVQYRSSASSGTSAPASRGSGSNATQPPTHPWASYEPAHYLTIGTGFHFAK